MPYAQTNIELFNQLQCDGYSKTDIRLVQNTYGLAVDLFAGRLLPSGRIFLAHVVRTASILATLRLSAEVVAAGLLHNAYISGDFGNGRSGISQAKRQEVRQVLGLQAEEYVARFPAMNLDEKPRTIRLAVENPNALELVERHVILIMLAEHLEHLLDFDILYYPSHERRYYIGTAATATEIAHRLGCSRLAAELTEARRQIESADLVADLQPQKFENSSRVLAPRSFCKRPGVTVHQAMLSLKAEIQKALFILKVGLGRLIHVSH